MKRLAIGIVALILIFLIKNYFSKKSESQPIQKSLHKSEVSPVMSVADSIAPEVRPPEEVSELSVPAVTASSMNLPETSANMENIDSIEKLTAITTEEQQLQRLADEKLEIPIKEELKAAKSFTTWEGSETFFTGPFDSKLDIKSKPYEIRMNLMFDGANNDITPTSCIGMYGAGKTIFQTSYASGKMNFLRTKDKKYIIISVQDKFYFQIFQTRSGRRRAFRTHLSITGQAKPLVFTFSDSSRREVIDNCENIQDYLD